MVTARWVRRIGRATRRTRERRAYAAAMSTSIFDPTAPLAGPPDPWQSTSQPSPRGTPPFHMTEMIEAEPALAERILAGNEDASSAAGALAGAISRAIRAGGQVIVTGCGTSEHAAQGVAEILREGVRAARL